MFRLKGKRKLNKKICLIEENTLAHSSAGYVVLTAGTPVILKRVIKDLETKEDIALIIDFNGNEYKMLDADLLYLDEEEISLLMDDNVPNNCERSQKNAEILQYIPFVFISIFGLSLLFLNIFHLSSPNINLLLFSLCTSISLVPAFFYVRDWKKGKYPVSEDYFANYEENKGKLKRILEEERKREEE